MRHECHWTTCRVNVPPRLWGCKKHWRMLPRHLQREIWRHYRPGQEIDKRPSAAYIETALKVQRWIAEEIKAGRAT